MKFLLLLTMVTCCGTALDLTNTPINEPGMNPLADETIQFEELTGKLVTTVISFRPHPYDDESGPVSDKTLAYCAIEYDYVRVNAKLFSGLDARTRFFLLAHEVLHCQYGVDHITGRLSVMNSKMHNTETLRVNNNDLMDEIKELTQ